MGKHKEDTTRCNHRERDITLVEDCAHVLGSKWRGKALGSLGLLGCYSTQTNKLINRWAKLTQNLRLCMCSGEGGFLVTSNEKLMATAVIHSGSYGHFHTVGKVNNQSILFLLQHNACPEDEQLMWEAHASVPNFSLRKVYICVSGKEYNSPSGKYIFWSRESI